MNNYRIKINYLDGSSEYSKIQSYNFVRKPFKLYPNPNDGRIVNLYLEDLKGEFAQINILNLEGKLLYQKDISVSSNNDNLTINLQEELQLDKGMYILSIKHNSIEEFQKLIIK